MVYEPNWYTFGWWNFWNAVILLLARMERLRSERKLDPAETIS